MKWEALATTGFGLLLVIGATTGAHAHMRAMLAPAVGGRVVAQRYRVVVDDGSVTHHAGVTVRTDDGATHHFDRTFFQKADAEAWLAEHPEGGRMRLQFDPRNPGDSFEADTDDGSTAIGVVGIVTMLIGLWWATHG